MFHCVYLHWSVRSPDYEEDFEADDEGPADEAEAKEVNSPSPCDQTRRQVNARGASDTEDEEAEGGCTLHLLSHPSCQKKSKA